MEEEKQKTEEKVKEVSEKEESVSTPSNGDTKKTLISIVIGLVLVIVALELSGTTSLFGSSAVATVNGEKITQEQFDTRVAQIFSTDQAQLIDLEDPALRKSIEDQILDEIVNTRLLLQKAGEEGFVATDAEVETEYQLILERLGSELNTSLEKEDLLRTELVKNGLTETSFRENIADQLIIEQYFSSVIDDASLTPAEEEIDKYYLQLTESQEGVPPLDEIRTEIETQIISQKRQLAIGGVIEELRTEADITIAQ